MEKGELFWGVGWFSAKCCAANHGKVLVFFGLFGAFCIFKMCEEAWETGQSIHSHAHSIALLEKNSGV
jgi:hypothetical protein